MSLKFIKPSNSSEPNEEIIRLEATEDVNLLGYAIVDRTFSSTEKLSNEFRHIFVFPTTKVKKGEIIRLYSGIGKYAYEKNINGVFVHRFYWGAKECVWNDNGKDYATLIKFSIEDRINVPVPA